MSTYDRSYPRFVENRPGLYHPQNASYANSIAMVNTGADVPVVVLKVPIEIGRPYTLNVAEIGGNTGPAAGPTSLNCLVRSTGSYATEETVEFSLGRFDSVAIQHQGPMTLSASVTANTAVAAESPTIAAWVSLDPAVETQWPISSSIEQVQAAFTAINLNNGFPQRYRQYLTLCANGQLDIELVARGGARPLQLNNLTAQDVSTIFKRFPIDAESRIFLRQSGGAPATTCAVIWTDK